MLGCSIELSKACREGRRAMAQRRPWATSRTGLILSQQSGKQSVQCELTGSGATLEWTGLGGLVWG